MNKQISRAFLLILAFVILSTPVCAVEFQPIGFETLSMGGAGVASARGGIATYYNPALLLDHEHGAQIPFSVGGGIREINITQHIDRLSEIEIYETIQNIANNATLPFGSNTTEDRNNITTIKNTLRSMLGVNGLQLMPTAALGIQMGNFGFGFYGISEATAYAVIDTQRLDLIIKEPLTEQYFEYDETADLYIPADENAYTQRSLEYALNNKLTYLKLTGLVYTELFMSHARSFKLPLGELNLGAAVKIMPGYTFDEKIDINTKSRKLDNELRDRENYDMSWGIDLGILYKPQKIENLSLGLVLKNINTPEFETNEGNTLKVKPQIRTGITYDFWGDRITLAIDADLTNNKTFVPGYESQMIGGGLNIHPYNWLCLRAGAMRNMKDNEEGVILTAGLGFGLKWLQLDIAGQMSNKRTEFDGEKIPNYARVQVSLVSKWF